MTQTNKTATNNLPLEELLRNQIYNALQGDVIDQILKKAKVRKSENYWRNILEGHSFKVDEKISGKLYKMFHEVKVKLGFKDDVDFYISGNADVNAFALSGSEEGEPHIINLNSSLIKLMTDDELRFVIGHEMGHLINKNTDLIKLIHFVFPDSNNVPALLSHKIRLWNQLSELIADRYGYLAIPNIEVCISAFFKMSSGLDSDRVDLQIDAFLDENNKRLEYFKNDNGLNYASHPINPIRVKAIQLFSNCQRFNIGDKNALTEDTLQVKMDELIQILMKVRSSELDYHLAHFIASAGLIVADIDNEVDDLELDIIISNLSEFIIFPKKFLEDIAQSGRVTEIFKRSIESILEISPAERENMIQFLISVVMADRELKNDEVELIYQIGINIFGYSVTEVAQIFAVIIQNRFMPSIRSLG